MRLKKTNLQLQLSHLQHKETRTIFTPKQQPISPFLPPIRRRPIQQPSPIPRTRPVGKTLPKPYERPGRTIPTRQILSRAKLPRVAPPFICAESSAACVHIYIKRRHSRLCGSTPW